MHSEIAKKYRAWGLPLLKIQFWQIGKEPKGKSFQNGLILNIIKVEKMGKLDKTLITHEKYLKKQKKAL